MKSQQLAILAIVLAASETVLASTKQTVYCQNAQNCNPTGSKTSVSTTVAAAKRSLDMVESLTALFRRDSEFEYAMGILARNAAAAEKSVDDIIKDINAGTVDPEIVKAAKAKGIIAAVAKGGAAAGGAAHQRREAAKGGKSAGGAAAGGKKSLPGPKGGSHSVSSIAQHIMSGGYVPPRIIAALKSSKHYLAPGQTHKNPTGAAGGAKGKKSKGAGKGAIASRDLGDDESFDIFARAEEHRLKYKKISGLVKKMNKNEKVQEQILKELNADAKVQGAFKKLAKKYGGEDSEEGEEGEESKEVTMADLNGLFEHAREDKAARKHIMKFFNKEGVKAVTEKLIEKYHKKTKREADEEHMALVAARDAEALAASEFDEFFQFDARDPEITFEAELNARAAEADFEGSFYELDF